MSRVDVDWLGTWGGPKVVEQCRNPAEKEESSDSERIGGDAGLPVGEPLRVKRMCDKKCNEKSFKFDEFAAIVTEEGDTPHTLNLCRGCHDRLTEQGETKVSDAVLKDVIRQKTTRGRLRAALGSDGFLPNMWE